MCREELKSQNRNANHSSQVDIYNLNEQVGLVGKNQPEGKSSHTCDYIISSTVPVTL